MAQSVKVIDVTRSYVPIDPKAFPETYHGTKGEDFPEDRIPVVPYEGYNFLPTSQGYKSFFGTNQSLGIDALTSRVDKIFITQTQTYDNILVALCEDGIWTKSGDVAGSWDHVVTLSVPTAGTHLNWTYCVIGKQVFCYRAQGSAYYRFDAVLDDPYEPTTVVPTFLNMSGQQGIFKAGIRLGFWDSENSISWSSIDDLGEFTPDIETLAGSAIFTDVTGRISTILDLENGFVVYANRSIVYIAQAVSATFQWNPQVLLSTGGVFLPEQAIRGSEVGEHFAITSSGIVKIQTSPGSQIAKLDFIIPEVFDYFSKTANPFYLQLLNNRYLCFQTIDETYISAAVDFTYENTEPISYYFPGSSYIADLYPEETLEGIDFCTKSGIIAGNGFTVEQQEQAQAAWEAANTSDPETYPPPAQNAWTTYEAVWEGHLQVQDVPNPDDITWGSSPCTTLNAAGTADLDMCPSTTVLRNDTYGTGSSGTLVIPGSSTYTLKQLIQMQKALWTWEDQKRDAYISEILDRAKTSSLHLTGAYTPTAYTTDTQYCAMGYFTASGNISEEDYGANKCSYWIERAYTDFIEIKRKKVTITNTVAGGTFNENTSILTWLSANVSIPEHSQVVPTPGPSSAVSGATYIYSKWAELNPTLVTYYTSAVINNISLGGGGSPAVVQYDVIGPSGVSPGGIMTAEVWSSEGTRDITILATNEGTPITLTQMKSRAFFKLIGWKYKDAQGVEHIVPGLTDPECRAPDDEDFDAISDGIISGAAPILGPDGSICGEEFPSITLPGYSISPLTWPSITVGLPPATFLLQKGSIGPIYPTFHGAFLYDLRLKKWGKLKADFKLLLDYTPINTFSDKVISAEDFILMAGMLDSTGVIYLFDTDPVDSYICWGKIGYYRKGVTNIQEVIVHFTENSTGSLETQTSLDGVQPEGILSTSQPFDSVIKSIAYPSISGRWHNVIVRGNYNLKYLEVRGFQAGRR